MVTDTDLLDGPRILYVNGAFECTTGWLRADVLGRSASILHGPETDGRELRRVRDTLAKGCAVRTTLLQYARDGRTYWSRSRIHPVAKEGGAIEAFVFVQADLTLEHRLNAERGRLAEWFERGASGALSALYMLSPRRDGEGRIYDFTCEYCNPMGGVLMRCDPRALVGRSVRESVPGSRIEKLVALCREVMDDQQPRIEEYEVPEYPAGMRWLRHQIVPLSDGVTISAENITARKTSEIELRRREGMLNAFLANCPGLAWIADDKGNTLAANAAYVELLESMGGQSLPATLWELYPKEQADLYLQNNIRVAETGQSERVLEPSVRSDGSMGLFETFKFPLGPRGEVRLVGGIAIDITDREGEHRIAERLASIVRSSGDAIISLDPAGHILSWNRGADELYGHAADEVIGSHLSVLVPPNRIAESEEVIGRVLAGEPLVRFETVRMRRNGGLAHVQLSLSSIADRDGRCVGISEIATDVGERHRQEAQSRYFAEHDPVTGALNEHGLLLATARRLRERPGNCAVMLRLSMDRYFEFRDVFGATHAAEMMRQVIRRLEQAGDVQPQEVALVGPNEFAMLAGCWGGGEAEVAERLEALQAHMGRPLEVKGIEVSLRAQCGGAMFPRHADNAEELLRCADLALGISRRRADGRPVVYEPAMGTHVAYQVRLQHELRRAVERGQLRVVLQPIYDSRGSAVRIIGMEALARWTHPELGVIPPQQFIPVAEESGLICEIGSFVLKEACRLKAAVDEAGHEDLFLSVNVSRDQFRAGGLPEEVAAALEASGVAGDRLELEITESLLMEHTAEGEQQLAQLGRMGVGLVVDDFGTGYSSLAYLQRFPLTKLKIDRSFVAGLPQDRGANEIVRTILALAGSLGLKAVAEGVETAEQHDALQQLGCRQYQGYLFSHPLEADEFKTLLVRRDAGGATREAWPGQA